jgi:carbon monoxide dehydrogenase subunit G
LAITFSGEFTSPRTPDEVYDFLCNPNKFAPLLPDFESMSVQDATHFTVKVRVGVGNIRGSAEIKMELAESARPSRAQYKGRGNAVGSQITVSAGFDLSAIEAGTKIAWQGEAGVFGKLASMAGGMLEPLGKKNIQKLIDGLQWALTWPPAQAVMPEVPRAAVLSASAAQPGQARPQPPPDEAVQGTSAPQTSGPAAVELAGAGLENTSLQQLVNPTAAEIQGDHDDSPQGETKVAQDVSPG